MNTSFKKAMKGFLKSIPEISYLTHKEYLTGGGSRGLGMGAFCQWGFCRVLIPDLID